MHWDQEDLKSRGLISSGFHLPYNPNLLPLAKEMRKRPTKAENMLWKGLLRNLKHRFLRQRPIDNFIVDFYCPKLKLVVEVDGDAHFSEEGKDLDKERTIILESYGLKVIRVTDSEVLDHFEVVRKKIKEIPL